GMPDLLLAVNEWGSPQLFERFGRLNATECIASAMGYQLKDAVPRLKRPVKQVNGRVIIIANGSVPTRSIPQYFVDEISAYLTFKGYEVIADAGHFDSAREYADFISSAEYMISVFTGPMHIAAAMGIKTVALCIGDSPWAYRPLQKNVAVLDSRCDLCWFEHAAVTWVCGEEKPLCVREHSALSVMNAMKDLDKRSF
ncbi:MAG: hypothetical protein HRT88_06045, partial [Lentisphaeraceae bacterium]|nr:hypothetical protein [Lentisphaeraceae bacterium]